MPDCVSNYQGDLCFNRECSNCQRGCEGNCQSGCQVSSQGSRTDNTPPMKSRWIDLPNVVTAGETFKITWSIVDNIAAYELERSINNGQYNTIYTGTVNAYSDAVSIDAKNIRYRVRARNNSGVYGDYRTSGIVYVETNKAPVISGNDYDYGAVREDFTIPWMVSDADNDAVTVTITVSGKVVYNQKTTLNVNNQLDIKLADYNLGDHRVEIVARDAKGTTAKRIYRFTKINTPPKFNVPNGDLGDKNTPFSFTYQIADAEGDNVSVVEYLDDEIIRSRSTVELGTDLTITIDDAKLRSLELGKTYKIRIEAEDDKKGRATLVQTFRRANFAPTILIQDSTGAYVAADVDIGEKTSVLGDIKFKVEDIEGDTVDVKVDYDGVKTLTPTESDGIYTIGVDRGLGDFVKVRPGRHAIHIEAADSTGNTSRRTISFTRVVARLVMQLKDPIETDAAARKILIIPNWRVAKGAEGRIYACNNFFDETPTWEDITSMVTSNLNYNFKNAKRTADKWGISVKIVVERKTATTNSYVYGIGGAFE